MAQERRVSYCISTATRTTGTDTTMEYGQVEENFTLWITVNDYIYGRYVDAFYITPCAALL